MKKLEQKMKMAQNSLKKYHRKFSESSFDKNKNNHIKINTSMINVNIFKSTNENIHNKTIVEGNNSLYEDKIEYKTDQKNDNHKKEEEVTPFSNNASILPEKFQEIYRKSIKNVMQLYSSKKTNKNIENNNKENKNEQNNENNKDKLDKKTSLFNLDSQESSSTQPKVEEKEKEKEEENEQDDLSDSSLFEKKIFDDLVICNEKNFSVGSIKNLIEPFGDRLKKNNKVKENLQKLLILTQQRRNNLINKRKNIRERLEKVGYKIRE